MNVLVTSISKKVPMLKAVRRAMDKAGGNGLLFGADADPDCIGSFFVDRFWTSPPIGELTVDDLVWYCRTHGIAAIIPSRDGELSFFAGTREALRENGINVMVSSQVCVDVCIDKLRFYHTLLEAGFPVISTYEQLSFNAERYVVKERYGAGSAGAGVALDACQAVRHAKKLRAPVFQPYVGGREVSVDVYVDAQGKTKGVIPRRRIRVVGGESQITKTFRDEALEHMCAEMAESLGAYGHVLFQLIEDRFGEWHVLECNARFGGASTLSVAAGLDSFYWFLQESHGRDLSKFPFERSRRELTLIRHAEDLIQ
jgi:carbamoyl-phosphate synthase large subunit